MFHVGAQRRRDRTIGRPHAVLVGLAVVPEPSTLHLAQRGRKRSEVGVAAGFPIDVLEPFPLRLRDWRAFMIAKDHESLLVENIQLAMGHGELLQSVDGSCLGYAMCG